MSHSDPKKILKQIESKPAKQGKYKKHNLSKDRTCGRTNKKCSRCGRITGHIGKYGLNLCRQCFREIASDIGFKKYN